MTRFRWALTRWLLEASRRLASWVAPVDLETIAVQRRVARRRATKAIRKGRRP